MSAAPVGDSGATPPAGPPPNAEELQAYLDVALAAAREAGAVIAAAWNAPKQIDTKSGDADLVTGGATLLCRLVSYFLHCGQPAETGAGAGIYRCMCGHVWKSCVGMS